MKFGHNDKIRAEDLKYTDFKYDAVKQPFMDEYGADGAEDFLTNSHAAVVRLTGDMQKRGKNIDDLTVDDLVAATADQYELMGDKVPGATKEQQARYVRERCTFLSTLDLGLVVKSPVNEQQRHTRSMQRANDEIERRAQYIHDTTSKEGVSERLREELNRLSGTERPNRHRETLHLKKADEQEPEAAREEELEMEI